MSKEEIYNRISRFLLLLALIMLVYSSQLTAQVTKSAKDSTTTNGQPVQIKNAGLMEFHDKIRTLTGNVQLEQNGVDMFCDKADFYEEENNVEAFGHVRLKQDTINIYSDRLSYKGNDRKAKFFDNVRLTDAHITLTTQQLDYDMNTKIANYSTGGVIKNDSSTLTSDIGYYYSKTDDAYFRRNVRMVNPRYVLTADTLRFNTQERIAYFCGPTNINSDSSASFCEGGYYNTLTRQTEFTQKAVVINYPHIIQADTIYYDPKEGIGRAISHVDWLDTSRKTIIRCNKAFYNNKKSLVLATGEPLFIDASEKDSLFMRADTLYSTKADTGSRRMFLAYHHVKIFRLDLQAVCDSLSYSDVDSLFHFYKNPILWLQGNQLTADSISLLRGRGRVKQFFMRLNSLIISEADTGEYNQVKGRNITGFFDKNKLKKLYVQGNGETIYYASDDKKKPIGVNKAVCSNIEIWIKDDKIQRIKFMQKPDAVLYPPGKLPPEDSKLRGFRWEIAKRPMRDMF